MLVIELGESEYHLNSRHNLHIFVQNYTHIYANYAYIHTGYTKYTLLTKICQVYNIETSGSFNS